MQSQPAQLSPVSCNRDLSDGEEAAVQKCISRFLVARWMFQTCMTKGRAHVLVLPQHNGALKGQETIFFSRFDLFAA